jgi:hypothetical protein
MAFAWHLPGIHVRSYVLRHAFYSGGDPLQGAREGGGVNRMEQFEGAACSTTITSSSPFSSSSTPVALIYMFIRGLLLSSTRPLSRNSVSISSTSRSFSTTSLKMSFSPLYTKPTAADRDLSTLSNYLDIRTTHTDLQWAIDWDAKTIGGQATISLEATNDVDCAVLDTSFLKIDSVEIAGTAAVRACRLHLSPETDISNRSGASASASTTQWASPSPSSSPRPFAQERCVGFKIEAANNNKSVDILVKYSTTKDCTSVGWLNPV